MEGAISHKKRSVGVTIAAWIELIIGVGFLLYGLRGLESVIRYIRYMGNPFADSFPAALTIMIIFCIIIGIWLTISSLFIFKLHPAGRVMSLIFLGILLFSILINLLIDLLHTSINKPILIIETIISKSIIIIPSSIGVIFLTRPKVKEQFKK